MNTTFEEELNRSGKLLYTNVGVSMRPLLREGRDVMVIERAESFRALDVVLFRRPGVVGRGTYVLHRILKVLPENRFWIVGDNCVDGEIVEAGNVLGVLTAIQRGGKLLRVSDFQYRLYVWTWCAPYRLRFFILRAKGWLKRHGF